VGDKIGGGTQTGGRGRGMETTGSVLSCSARSARVEMGRGEDQIEEEHINTCIRGGRHCNR
jgi:hypothetical protein